MASETAPEIDRRSGINIDDEDSWKMQTISAPFVILSTLAGSQGLARLGLCTSSRKILSIEASLFIAEDELSESQERRFQLRYKKHGEGPPPAAKPFDLWHFLDTGIRTSS